MRPVLILAFLSIFTHSNAQKADTTVSAHGRIVLANRGFAPVPAFSFNNPIVIGFVSVKKKNFSYDPDAAIGLNGKPWMANNWFRVSLPELRKWKSNVGLNPSLFFKTEIINLGEEIVHAHRNLTFEAVGERKFSTSGSLRFSYMLIHAFDKGTLSGHFLDMSSTFTLFRLWKKTKIVLRPQLFYFNFEGNVDGFFSSANVGVQHSKIPLSVYFQGVAPIWSDFPGNTFKWNSGITYAF